MARNNFTKGKEITLRSAEAHSTPEVKLYNKISIAALAFVLTEEKFAYMVMKPQTSGGFGLTIFDGDDKIKTYLSPLDEPHEVAEELLDQLCGAHAVRLYRKLCTALEAVESILSHENTQSSTLPIKRGKKSSTDNSSDS